MPPYRDSSSTHLKIMCVQNIVQFQFNNLMLVLVDRKTCHLHHVPRLSVAVVAVVHRRPRVPHHPGSLAPDPIHDHCDVVVPVLNRQHQGKAVREFQIWWRHCFTTFAPHNADVCDRGGRIVLGLHHDVAWTSDQGTDPRCKLCSVIYLNVIRMWDRVGLHVPAGVVEPESVAAESVAAVGFGLGNESLDVRNGSGLGGFGGVALRRGTRVGARVGARVEGGVGRCCGGGGGGGRSSGGLAGGQLLGKLFDFPGRGRL